MSLKTDRNIFAQVERYKKQAEHIEWLNKATTYEKTVYYGGIFLGWLILGFMVLCFLYEFVPQVL